jgi:GGDEF domain-containing protein
MKAPSLSAWFMWCSLVGFGIILPMAIGQNPDHAFIVYLLRALGCAGFIIGLVALIRSSGASAPGLVAEDAIGVVPRTLCNNPLAAAHAAPLADRIDMALEASALYGRSFGVVTYDLESYRRIVRSHGHVAAEAAMEFLLGMLQLLLRPTDRTECVGKGRFVICLALLPDEDTLHAVRDRAARAIREMRIEALNGDRLEYDSGFAIYPVHGKCGADLIAHAQRACDAAREQRLREDALRSRATASVGQSCAA